MIVIKNSTGQYTSRPITDEHATKRSHCICLRSRETVLETTKNGTILFSIDDCFNVEPLTDNGVLVNSIHLYLFR